MIFAWWEKNLFYILWEWGPDYIPNFLPSPKQIPLNPLFLICLDRLWVIRIRSLFPVESARESYGRRWYRPRERVTHSVPHDRRPRVFISNSLMGERMTHTWWVIKVLPFVVVAYHSVTTQCDSDSISLSLYRMKDEFQHFSLLHARSFVCLLYNYLSRGLIMRFAWF
jgi:hypothetical protein